MLYEVGTQVLVCNYSTVSAQAYLGLMYECSQACLPQDMLEAITPREKQPVLLMFSCVGRLVIMVLVRKGFSL